MRSSRIPMLALSLCIPLAVAADDSIQDLSIGNFSSCAVSCLATFTQCPLDDAVCLCYETSSSWAIQHCLLQHCSLDDGIQFKHVIESSCNPSMAPSKQRVVLAVTLGLSSAALLLVLLRIPLQLYKHQEIFAENWFLLLASTAQAAFAALVSLAVYDGLGLHLLDVHSELLTTGLIYMFYATPVYWLVLLLSRLSVILLLRRVNPGRTYRILTAAMMTFVVTWGVLAIVLSALQCRPISYNWDMFLDRNVGATQGTCLNLDILATASNVISLFQDVLILFLAIPILLLESMTPGKRLGTCFIAVFGLFICVASGVRLSSLITFSSNTIDPTWDNVPEIMWSVIETSAGNMLVCLPVLGDFLMKLTARCLNLPDESFEGSNNANITYIERANENEEHQNQTADDEPFRTKKERQRKTLSIESFRVNGIEYTFEVQQPPTDAELVSIRSRDSQQRLSQVLKSDQAESLLPSNSDSRDHLNQTYKEHDRRPAGPRTPPKRRGGGKRLASPTQGIFRDAIWRSEDAANSLQPQTLKPLQPSWPLRPSRTPTPEQQRLRPVPLRLWQNANIPASDSQASMKIPPRTTKTDQPTKTMGFPFPDTIRSPVRNSESWRKSHLSAPGDARGEKDLPALSRPKSNPTLRPRRTPPAPQQLNATLNPPGGPLNRQVILEHRDENPDERGTGKENEKMVWPLPEEWASTKSSRIRRSRSGRAIVFNGQILNAT